MRGHAVPERLAPCPWCSSVVQHTWRRTLFVPEACTLPWQYKLTCTANPPLTHPAQCVIDVDLNSLQFGLDAPFFKLLVDQRDRPTGPLPTLVAQVSGRTWTAGGDE